MTPFKSYSLILVNMPVTLSFDAPNKPVLTTPGGLLNGVLRDWGVLFEVGI
ncbi:MAG: hypothetical protein P4L69_00525 [Desulfosporosinus sp.]|nr:hypothetical protein [Desulfosporosinus sp.]